MPVNPQLLSSWEVNPSKTQGLEEYGKAMGYSEDQRKAYASLVYTMTLSQQGDAYRVEVDYRGSIPTTSYVVKEGQTIDYKSPDDRCSQLTLTVEDGDTIETFLNPQTNVSWVVRRTVEGDIMTCITTFEGHSMTQVFHRMP